MITERDLDLLPAVFDVLRRYDLASPDFPQPLAVCLAVASAHALDVAPHATREATRADLLQRIENLRSLVEHWTPANIAQALGFREDLPRA